MRVETSPAVRKIFKAYPTESRYRQKLATVHEDGTVKLFDTETGKQLATLKGHAKVVLAVAFAPDGKTIATAGSDGTVKRWAVRR